MIMSPTLPLSVSDAVPICPYFINAYVSHSVPLSFILPMRMHSSLSLFALLHPLLCPCLCFPLSPSSCPFICPCLFLCLSQPSVIHWTQSVGHYPPLTRPPAYSYSASIPRERTMEILREGEGSVEKRARGGCIGGLRGENEAVEDCDLCTDAA